MQLNPVINTQAHILLTSSQSTMEQKKVYVEMMGKINQGFNTKQHDE